MFALGLRPFTSTAKADYDVEAGALDVIQQTVIEVQVQYVEEAVLHHVVWADNFYHSMEVNCPNKHASTLTCMHLL